MKPREQNKFTNRKKERKKERKTKFREREKVSSNERIETKWFWRETLRNERSRTTCSSSNILNIVSHFSSSKMMMLLSSCVPISDS